MPHKNHKLKVVLVSGPVCSGKSALVEQLGCKHHARIIKTRELILKLRPRTKDSRPNLQKMGQKLDRERGGQWVAQALEQVVYSNSWSDGPSGLFVVDSVRTCDQVHAIRAAYGADVHHIHLTATDSELRERYYDRQGEGDADVSYEKVKRNQTEKNIERLASIADVVVETDRCSEEAVLVRATALLNLYPRSNQALVDVLVGGQYGSEGKGNIVGHIAPEYDLLIRVGGPNAGHQVYAEPEPEKYYHLPSGTERGSDADLLLGPGAVINPRKLLDEISKHEIGVDRLTIDGNAVIIFDEDIQDEKKRFKSISSTAQGVGVAAAKKILGRSDYKDDKRLFLAKDCEDLKPFIGDSKKIISEALVQEKRILLEGTQGTSLSLHHGQYPHVTSRDTTVAGCLADAGIPPSNVRKVVMVCRTYPIRVGGPSGPLENEIDVEEISDRSGINSEELRKIETTTTTGRNRRIAEFDWVQFRDSVQLNGPTDIALTFVDYYSEQNRSAYRFEQLSEETIRFVEELERVSGRPVSLLSTDFNWRNVIDRRAW